MEFEPILSGTYAGLDTFSTAFRPSPSYEGKRNIHFRVSMNHVDDNTEVTFNNLSTTVDNILIKPVGNGFDLLLLHELEAHNGHVDKADQVAVWHFNDLQHLESFRDFVTNSLRNPKPVTDADIKTTKDEFEDSLKKATRKTD